MTSTGPDITVVGAGVIGLTTAISLAKNGFKVQVVAEHFSPDTTSDGAAAIWEPFAVEPKEKAAAWAAGSLEVFHDQASDSLSGVFAVTANHLNMTEMPWWADLTRSWLETRTLPSGRLADCFRYDTFIADMSLYMPWLRRLAEDQGVHFRCGRLASIEGMGPVVVCAGNGARDLLGDKDIRKARGVVLVFKGRLTEDAWVDGSDMNNITYILPRRNHTIVGGTYEPGVESDVIDALLTDRIHRNATRILPILASFGPERQWCGFRPSRPTVRLHKDAIRPDVYYNYGHGGAGLTSSWGCAADIVELCVNSPS